MSSYQVQILGHQEDRRHRQGPVAGPLGRRRPRALQVLPCQTAGRRVPDHPQDAARDGTPFDTATGLPAPPSTARGGDVTWYEHACAYSQMKWPDLAAKSRRSTAEALTTITLALTRPRLGVPDPAVLRQALLSHAFNAASARQPVPADIPRALAWIAKASLPVAALEEPDTVRGVLNACARRLDGKPAAATTTRRKRAVFANALGYAVERRLLPASPLGQIQWKAADGRRDRRPPLRRQPRPGRAAPGGRPGAGPARASTWKRSSAACTTPRCAPPKPSRSANPTASCRPPGGAGSTWPPPHPAPGPAGPTTAPAARNAASSTAPPGRPAASPSRPSWSPCSAPTSTRYGTSPDGRLFRTARGGPLNDTGWGEVWQRARPLALTPAQQASPLARRPYDLRHAAVSLWLNAGVPATEVARRAGHGVAVLLKVYANCIDGQAAAANQRISDALRGA